MVTALRVDDPEWLADELLDTLTGSIQVWLHEDGIYRLVHEVVRGKTYWYAVERGRRSPDYGTAQEAEGWLRA